MTEKHGKEEDEEIAIDFSKIKNWFKKKKGEKEHTEHEHAETKEGHKASEEEKEIKLSYKETINFFKKYSTVFLILIPVILTIYLRLQPMNLPMTDDWAQSTVYNYYKNQVSTQINQQYPNLPDANKQALIDAGFEKLLQQNKDVMQQQIETTSQQFKERLMYESGDSKYVYLGDIDSYFWLRDARKVIETGRNCDDIDYENNICYIDTYTQAPMKSPTELGKEKTGFYTSSIIYTYKIIKLFNPDITIMQASFYVPLIYMVISVILAFLIGKLLAGNLAGLIASIFITVNPITLSRTLGSDNDAQNIIYPLLIFLLFLYAIKSKDSKRIAVFSILTGIAIGLYAWAWQGWWYIFNFIIATLIIYGLFHITRQTIKLKNIAGAVKTEETKKIAIMLLLIAVSSVLFITLTSGFGTFLNFIKSPFWFAFETKAAGLVGTFWPNVLVTVAEFNPGSIGTIISQMGGKLIFFLGMLGILFIMISKGKIRKEQKYILGIGAVIYLILVSNYGINLGPKIYMALIALPVVIGMIILLKSKEETDVKFAILLAIWFVATTYAALKGVRFTLLMASAFGVALSTTIAAIYRIVSKWVSSELKINEIITKTIVALLLLLILIGPVKAGYHTATHFIPSVNDAWYTSLIKIRDNSESDAIINSWWDFGHWFKYIADRRVTLDGSSQSGPPLHWLGKLMITDNEKHSVGILRMLDCGSNSAFNELNSIVNNAPKSIKILDHIVTLGKREAGEFLLENRLTKNEASAVLKYTHCNPPEDFFITSEDMVGKAGVWSHFGSWDFERAEMYQRVKGLAPEEGKNILLSPKYNLTSGQADQYYYEIQTQDGNHWIASWPGYMSGVRACETPDAEGMMVCNQILSNSQQIPLTVNLTDMDVIMPATGNPKPTSIVYITENGTEEKRFEQNLLDFSVVLIPQGEAGYSSLITHPYLANSMFTRLFYLEGHGLRYFDKFEDQHGVTGGRIIVWKVDWEGTDANAVYQAVDVSEIAEEEIDEMESSEIETDETEEDGEESETEETEETGEELEEDPLTEIETAEAEPETRKST